MGWVYVHKTMSGHCVTSIALHKTVAGLCISADAGKIVARYVTTCGQTDNMTTVLLLEDKVTDSSSVLLTRGGSLVLMG